MSNESDAVDNKITKRHYPRSNNEDIIEFVFEKDPNLYLRKNKITIRGAITCDEGYVVENGFASKLFSTATIEVESQPVTKTSTRFDFLSQIEFHLYFRGEFFLTDYIYKKGNFDMNMIDSVYQGEGQFDQYNLTGAELALLEDELIVNPRRRGASQNGKKWCYEFAFTPNFGFLASPEPLPNNCELKIKVNKCSKKVVSGNKV